MDKIFMLTLITFHHNDKISSKKILENQKSVKLFVGYCQQSKQPDIFLKVIPPKTEV